MVERFGASGEASFADTVDAVAEFHEHAKGSFRDTDRVATAAMRNARRKKKVVDRTLLSASSA